MLLNIQRNQVVHSIRASSLWIHPYLFQQDGIEEFYKIVCDLQELDQIH